MTNRNYILKIIGFVWGDICPQGSTNNTKPFPVKIVTSLYILIGQNERKIKIFFPKPLCLVIIHHFMFSQIT